MAAASPSLFRLDLRIILGIILRQHPSRRLDTLSSDSILQVALPGGFSDSPALFLLVLLRPRLLRKALSIGQHRYAAEISVESANQAPIAARLASPREAGERRIASPSIVPPQSSADCSSDDESKRFSAQHLDPASILPTLTRRTPAIAASASRLRRDGYAISAGAGRRPGAGRLGAPSAHPRSAHAPKAGPHDIYSQPRHHSPVRRDYCAGQGTDRDPVPVWLSGGEQTYGIVSPYPWRPHPLCPPS